MDNIPEKISSFVDPIRQIVRQHMTSTPVKKNSSMIIKEADFEYRDTLLGVLEPRFEYIRGEVEHSNTGLVLGARALHDENQTIDLSDAEVEVIKEALSYRGPNLGNLAPEPKGLFTTINFFARGERNIVCIRRLPEKIGTKVAEIIVVGTEGGLFSSDQKDVTSSWEHLGGHILGTVARYNIITHKVQQIEAVEMGFLFTSLELAHKSMLSLGSEAAKREAATVLLKSFMNAGAFPSPEYLPKVYFADVASTFYFEEAVRQPGYRMRDSESS